MNGKLAKKLRREARESQSKDSMRQTRAGRKVLHERHEAALLVERQRKAEAEQVRWEALSPEEKKREEDEKVRQAAESDARIRQFFAMAGALTASLPAGVLASTERATRSPYQRRGGRGR